MSLLKLLGDNGFISYNKDVARNIGVYEAIVLGELCSIADLFNYEEFYFSQSKIANDTGLSEKQIRSAIEKLASYGFVTITKKGQPCKNWYLLNETIIFDYLKQFDKKNQLSKNDISSSAEMEQLDVPKMPNKIGKNGTTRCAKKEALLNNNTQVTIQSNNTNNNTSSIGKAEKRKTEKKSESQRRVDFLNALQQSEYDFSKKCVDRFITFKKIIKQDFVCSQITFNKWQYDFAIFALKHELNFEELYKLLDFALSDTECSKWLFKPENFVKRYDEFQQRYYFSNAKNKTQKPIQNNGLYKSFDKSSLDGKDFFAE